MRAVNQIGPFASQRPDGGPGDGGLDDPDDRVHADHGAHGQACGRRTAQAELDAGGGTGEDGGEEGGARSRDPAPTRSIAAQAQQRAVGRVSEQRAGPADVEDVGAERGEAAIGEDQGLNDHHRDHHQISGPGTEDHGQQHATQ